MREMLTKAQIADAMRNPDCRVCDGAGLYLQVSKNETGTVTGSWLFRFQMAGVSRQMGLGSIDDYSLAQARQKAADARELVARGDDPIDARKAAKAAKAAAIAKEAAQRVTFKELAERYIALHSSSWGSDVHRRQWNSSLQRLVYPHIGHLVVGTIDIAMVRAIFEPIWDEKTVTAKRTLGRVEKVMGMAVGLKLHPGPNPAQWRGLLQTMLAKPSAVAESEQQGALPWQQVPEFMAALAQKKGHPARCLAFTVMTGMRTDATIGARWDEVNFAEKTWRVPAARMKGQKGKRKPLTIPLSPAALRLIEQQPRDSKFIFPSPDGGQLAGGAMWQVMERMQAAEPGRWIDPEQEGKAVSVHGMRASFKSWATDETEFARELVEIAMGHAIGGDSESTYLRTDARSRRRELMDRWSEYVTRQPKVRQLRAAS